MTTTDLTDLRTRLVKLERSAGRWRAGCVLLSLVIVAGLHFSASPAVPDVLQSRKLEILDANNEVMVAADGGDKFHPPGIVLYGEKKKPLVLLTGGDVSGAITVVSAANKSKIELMCVNTAELSMSSSAGTKTIDVDAGIPERPIEHPSISIRTPEGLTVWHASDVPK